MANIKTEFLVERQGRTFALFAGLLDAAHQEGLKSVETQLLQIGDETNERTWIFRAVVTTERGTFSGHGDANPSNVNRAMVQVLPRMAETRAIARALRFAVNATVAALEELDEDEPTHASSQPKPAAVNPTPERQALRPQQQQQAAPVQQQRPQGQPQASTTATATPAQIRAIYGIAREQHAMNEADVEDRSITLFGVRPDQLTRKQASDLITSLKGSQG